MFAQVSTFSAAELAAHPTHPASPRPRPGPPHGYRCQYSSLTLSLSHSLRALGSCPTDSQARAAVLSVARKRPDIYFLLLNTKPPARAWGEHRGAATTGISVERRAADALAAQPEADLHVTSIL